MRLAKIQSALKAKKIEFEYLEEDGLGSLDFQFRGLRYHIWEFNDDGQYGVDTNVVNVGRSEDMMGDYEDRIHDLILTWPDMAIPG